MVDGFKLAKEHSQDSGMQGGMYLGLPFYFCAEGLNNPDMSGGGHLDWLLDFYATYPHLLLSVSMTRLVYSWQWGNMNYEDAMSLVHEMGRTGRIILVCNDAVEKNRLRLPSWATLVLMIPANGITWMAERVQEVEKQAITIAKSYTGCVFAFSAGPMSNALIPLMWRTNPYNTYIDFGGALDLEVHRTRTRKFLPDESNPDEKYYLQHDTLANQTCHETRWNVSFRSRFGTVISPTSARQQTV
jgi:hypothetical protein